MSKVLSQLQGRAMKIVFPSVEGQPEHEELVIQIALSCPDCGDHQLTIPGHHLRALHQLLGNFLAEFPSTHLSGEPAETVEQHSFASGRPPSDPSVN